MRRPAPSGRPDFSTGDPRHRDGGARATCLAPPPRRSRVSSPIAGCTRRRPVYHPPPRVVRVATFLRVLEQGIDRIVRGDHGDGGYCSGALPVGRAGSVVVARLRGGRRPANLSGRAGHGRRRPHGRWGDRHLDPPRQPSGGKRPDRRPGSLQPDPRELGPLPADGAPPRVRRGRPRDSPGRRRDHGAGLPPDGPFPVR